MKETKNLLLIIEDDRKLQEALKDFFIQKNYEVLTAQDGEEGMEIYFSNNQCVDLILLDGMLPKTDGYDVLKTIREYSSVPIIMITARESEAEELKGLYYGADYYIRKPFRLRVLQAYVENAIKRNRNDRKEDILCGALRIDRNAQKVYLEEQDLNLTPKEYGLLNYFIQRKNVVLSRDMILDDVWGYDYDGDIRTVDTLVKCLRKKLTEKCPYIQSVYGVGYRFEVENE